MALFHMKRFSVISEKRSSTVFIEWKLICFFCGYFSLCYIDDFKIFNSEIFS